MKQAEWIAHHRDLGHHPEHSPTVENPDLVRCDCGGIWRILTQDQIRKKFAHLGAIAKKEARGCQGGAAPSSGEAVRGQGVTHDRTRVTDRLCLHEAADRTDRAYHPGVHSAPA
jgi:hypothetical protein